MSAEVTTDDDTKVDISAVNTSPVDDCGMTGKERNDDEIDENDANLHANPSLRKHSPNASETEHQQPTEESIHVVKSKAGVPKKPAWGLPSAATGGTNTAAVDKKGDAGNAFNFAEIMNDQSRDRVAARIAYSNNVVDEAVSLAHIQAEQERLFQAFASNGKEQAPSSNLQDSAEGADQILSGIDEEERKMIELAMKNSLAECNNISRDEKDDADRFLTAKGTDAVELSGVAMAEMAEEKSDSGMAEAAIREVEAMGQQANAIDAKLAAKVTALTLESSEEEMIRAAIREADAKQRAEEEAKSLELVMKIQREEVVLARQRQQNSTMPTGNVRTMTRAELAAEMYGDKTPISAYNDFQYSHASENGFRMNQQNQNQPSRWNRRDRNTIVGPDNEIRTKHDVEVQGQTNASFLDLDIIDDETGLRTHVGNTAFNAFRKTVAGNYHSKGGQRGTSKGVATHGTGRAGSDADATKGGALDQHVRLHISKAINAGIIEHCNGVVKQGKEAVVYHAVGGIRSTETTMKKGSDEREQSNIGNHIGEVDVKPNKISMMSENDGFDVAIKVFKRIKEFKGRGQYVDGDPRYAGRPFRSFTERDQLEVWTEKEYRNLVRAYRADIPVPNPISYNDNIIFMRFLGEDGWPAPQIREINIRKASSKWTTLYEQVMESVKRLFQDARLVHGDLSEYNILIAPNSQVDNKSENIDSEDALQTVLIDFGQAVEVRHPKAEELLRRDLARVRDFFKKQGVKLTLSLEDALEFVIGDW
eukprot:CAMPEP_0197176780 /NCGR_PEP_ID=MMETSP1423-20130617/2589_1 /TAXON_ID=476441 /ORGANISM="Pseudo-nitzschia heimii, Strain UNC1101" /LENGTH=761 /DNA_ID=CAMNT_0042626201 /DNA_START=55 /DNA_END=2337 /DNA_ORIENTATION=-